MFVSEPKVKLLCVVGCCYHLLTQHSGEYAFRMEGWGAVIICLVLRTVVSMPPVRRGGVLLTIIC